MGFKARDGKWAFSNTETDKYCHVAKVKHCSHPIFPSSSSSSSSSKKPV
jgi:hypothetical protein